LQTTGRKLSGDLTLFLKTAPKYEKYAEEIRLFQFKRAFFGYFPTLDGNSPPISPHLPYFFKISGIPPLISKGEGRSTVGLTFQSFPCHDRKIKLGKK